MREGKAIIQYKWLYAFERGEDGKPKIIPEQAKIVKEIFERCRAGQSMRMIKEELERCGIANATGGPQWSIAVISGILKNEKYCRDVLLQKSFISDCISKKNIRYNGQLPKYLIQNHHEGIVSRDTFNAIQMELARRNAGQAASPTGL